VARQLWILRHGDAEPHGAAPDFDRRLTPRGEAQASSAGAALARLGSHFAAVFASPRVRARDTARLAVAALGGEPPLLHDPLAGGFEHADALALIGGFEDDATILLVGHEPDCSQLVLDFTGARIAMKKGGIAGMRLERGGGELIVLLRPRELEAIAGTPAHAG
jgi:phosphohistidine phosphatase